MPSSTQHPPPACIRVLVADDQRAVRQGLSIFLRAFDDLTLVGEATDGQQALSLCRQLRPDVVLMDLMMPRLDGISATRAICQHCPGIRVIALVSLEDKALAHQALEAGAFGCLLKTVSAEQLAAAIRAAGAGYSLTDDKDTHTSIQN